MNAKIFIIFVFFFLLGIHNPLNAQEPVYKHYTVEDGLPSSETYSAFQDSKGYMWFATDAGVSRFNGYEFENFDASDGLTDNTVFLITEDHKGRIWFGTFNCRLCYYDYGTDKIHPYENNDKIKKTLNFNKPIVSFKVDSNETIWLGFYYNGIYSCNKEGKVKQVIEIQNNVERALEIVDIEGTYIKGGIIDEKFEEKILKRKIKQTYIYNESYKVGNNKNTFSAIYPDFMNDFKMAPYGRGIFITYNKQFFLFNTQQNVKEKKQLKVPILLKDDIINSIRVEANYLWFSTIKDGVFKCKIDEDQLIIVEQFLKGISISRTYEDKQRGVWIQTLKEGVYYAPNIKIESLAIEGCKIEKIAIDTSKGELYFSTDNTEIYIIDATKPSRFHFFTKINKEIESIGFDDKYHKLIVGAKGLKKDFEQHNNYNLIGVGKSFLIDMDTIYIVSSFGLHLYKDYKEIYASHKKQKPIWCNSVIKFDNNVWVGSKEGIRVYKNDKLQNPFSNNKILNSAITSFEKINNRFLLVGTKSYGLVVLDEYGIVDVISEKEGLAGNLIRTIHVDSENIVWVGTNNGLSKLSYKNKGNYNINNITLKHGIPTSEITDILSFKNIIYLVTTKGLSFFDKKKVVSNPTSPKLYFSDFKVNNVSREISTIQTYSYKENFITINYEALNYRSLGEIEYQYRIPQIDTNWITTYSRSVQYPSLLPNNYTFEVKAKNEDGFWSLPQQISFTINPPYWLTWWFITLEVLLGASVVFFIFKYREKQLNQKNEAAQKITEAEKKMIELELKALRSQMNPHFIFNTLNSIQHYIANNDFRSTNKYLTQFARLIRTVLNLSEKNVITIQEEVDMLQLYLELEKMRFEQQFEYEIIISDDIDVNYDEIPSMLIQPYVENAIWHGLMTKKGKGKIKVEIKLEENYLCCCIEDNGIGRKKAAEIKAQRKIERKSVGMSITKERLDIINNNEVSVETIDLEDENGKALGTLIKIKILYHN